MANHSKKSRRTVLTTSLGTALTIAGCSARQQPLENSLESSAEQKALPSVDGALTATTDAALLNPSTMPTRQLGRTNIQLPVLGLGGAGKTPLNWPNAEQAAIAQVERALALGIRYFDTAASYGPSESFLG